MYRSSFLLAGIAKLACAEGKSLMGLTVSRGYFSALERCQQEEGWSLVPEWDLSRMLCHPVISCIGTCWQMRVWSFLSHDPSWDVTHTVKSCPSSLAYLGGQIPCMGRGWRMGGSDVYGSSFILSGCLSSFVQEAFPWGFGPLYGDTVSSFVWSLHPSSFPFFLASSLPISEHIY